MLDRVLGLASALSMVVGSVAGPAAPTARVAFTFQDPEIVESSALVATGDLFLTVNDSGDSGRVFVVDGSGEDRRGHVLGRGPGRRRVPRAGRTGRGLGGRHRRQPSPAGLDHRAPGAVRHR